MLFRSLIASVWKISTLKIRLNFDPTPSSLSTLTLPPILSTISLQILSPSPLPCGFDFLCSSRLPKFMNRLSILSAGIPHPKSWTYIKNLTYLGSLLLSLFSPWLIFYSEKTKDLSSNLNSSGSWHLFTELRYISEQQNFCFSKTFRLTRISEFFLLNLRELLNKFTKICWNLFLSPFIEDKS